jgi:uncharacterized protein HemY
VEEADLVERDTRLSPNNASIFYQLGMLRYLLDEYDKAQTSLETACRLLPQDYGYLMALALLHEKRFEVSGDEDQFNRAVESLKKLNEMQPANPTAQNILIRLFDVRRKKQGDASSVP